MWPDLCLCFCGDYGRAGRDFEKHVKFVERLVSILKVADLTQENVSCLNTSLVILMLSARENRLPMMLSSLGKWAQLFYVDQPGSLEE